jgi:hypothetical protein
LTEISRINGAGFIGINKNPARLSHSGSLKNGKFILSERYVRHVGDGHPTRLLRYLPGKEKGLELAVLQPLVYFWDAA